MVSDAEYTSALLQFMGTMFPEAKHRPKRYAENGPALSAFEEVVFMYRDTILTCYVRDGSCRVTDTKGHTLKAGYLVWTLMALERLGRFSRQSDWEDDVHVRQYSHSAAQFAVMDEREEMLRMLLDPMLERLDKTEAVCREQVKRVDACCDEVGVLRTILELSDKVAPILRDNLRSGNAANGKYKTVSEDDEEEEEEVEKQ